MKKHILSFLFLFLFWGASWGNAQTFQEYLDQFPTVNTATTWQDAAIAGLPTSGKSTLPAHLHKFIVGGEQWSTRYSINKLYPVGKIEVGGAVTVFIAATSLTYNLNTNTQISVDAFSYNKKSGAMLSSGKMFYLFSVGGDLETKAFMYTGKIETDGKTWLKVYQTGTGSAVMRQHAYKLSSKGMSFKKEF